MKTIKLTKRQAIKLNLTSTKPGVVICKPRVGTYNPRGVGSYSVARARPTF
jgi:hypothetical protein